jgi:hypothetical protein
MGPAAGGFELRLVLAPDSGRDGARPYQLSPTFLTRIRPAPDGLGRVKFADNKEHDNRAYDR